MADPKHPRKFSEEFKRQIVQLYDSGESAGDIGREYDLSHSTVHRWVKAIACKTPEEILELAESEGMSLTIDELEEVSGGHAWGNCSQVSTGHCSRE